jgi:hypothetical protein
MASLIQSEVTAKVFNRRRTTSVRAATEEDAAVVIRRGALTEVAIGSIVTQGVVKAFSSIRARRQFETLLKSCFLNDSTHRVGLPWLIGFGSGLKTPTGTSQKKQWISLMRCRNRLSKKGRKAFSINPKTLD